MLRSVLTWWIEQMRDLVPASLRPSLRARRNLVVSVIDDPICPAVELFLCCRGVDMPLGRYGLDDPGLRHAADGVPKTQRRFPVLRVPSGMLLDRDIILPLAAASHLKRVLGFEMDRLTPFRADEVFWTCSVTQRDAVRNRLHVRLTIVPRVQVQPALAALQRAGLLPARVEAPETAGPCRVIPLGPGQPDRNWLGQRLEAFALGGCGILAVAAAALPFVTQSNTWAGIDARIDRARPQVIEADILRGRIASGVTTTDAITTGRNEVGAPIEAIALLTDLLPDDTVLTQLSARQRKLTISGRSPAAARLIGTMAAHPLIHNPAFTAPVIRDGTSGNEMFSIRADVGP